MEGSFRAHVSLLDVVGVLDYDFRMFSFRWHDNRLRVRHRDPDDLVFFVPICQVHPSSFSLRFRVVLEFVAEFF